MMLLSACLFLFAVTTVLAQTRYYGKFLGNFKSNSIPFRVRGEVFIANEKTFFIKGFDYDGQGSDAYFWGDSSEEPTASGFIIPLYNESENVLNQYNGQNILLTLPNGKSVRDLKSLSVYRRKYQMNVGSVMIPSDDLPYEKSLGPLPSLAHDVRSDDVIILDAKTLFITNLFYDGAGPDAFFLAGKGIKPHNRGIKIPDENGSIQKLHGYTGENVTLQLPGDLTVFDIDWLALFCIKFEQNFGHVLFPEQANVPASMDDLVAALSEPLATGHPFPSSSLETDVEYYGKRLGDFRSNAHDVQGTIYAASEDTFYIRGFNYDGQGPDAYFWAGTSEKPSPQGFIIPDEFGTKQVLGKYSNQSIAITLPDGKKIKDIKWLSVWCRKFAVNFGSISISDNFIPPMAIDLGPLSSLAHGVRSGMVSIKDIKTIVIKRLYYDGAGPDAFFLVGKGDAPHPQGTKVPDENGSLQKLHGYQGEDIMLRLPDGLTVFDVQWFSLFCIAHEQNFGDIRLPSSLNVPADIRSLKERAAKEMKFDNCEEMFPGIMHVSWKVVGQDLVLQMAGLINDGEYLSFGRSGSEDRSAMIGADVAVAFLDGNNAKVVDYYLSAKSQCSQSSGACPDIKLQGGDNTKLLNWETVDGVFSVTYKRPLASGDGQDLSVPLSIPVSVVAAIGSINSQKEVSFHDNYYNKGVKKIHFGRYPPQDRCSPLVSSTTMAPGPWPQSKIIDGTTFRVQIGPTGGDKGYKGITGSDSWGLAFWINDKLIPELTVRRGTNYTFVVEGGDDPSNPAAFHPLYITSSNEGGGGQFIDRIGLPGHQVYAGIHRDANQNLIPTVGRLCEWKHKTIDKSDESETFEDFKKTLRLECKDGSPGTFYWTPDQDTPDLVYYQCFTHRHLGWKIHVVDANAEVAGAMEHHSGSTPTFSHSISLLFALIFLITLVC